MKYSFNRTNFNDFSVFEINKLHGRAYSIPYSSAAKLKKTPFSKERTSSDIVKMLSGKWDFKFYEKNTDVPDVIDTDALDFDSITVPSTWQRTGYDAPAYINCPYAFDDKPPYVPSVLPVGIYRKKFTASADKKYIISFLGVIPCIDLYINGEFAGYSEGAHNSAEFDITSLVKGGENELLAVIHKWSNATFLECQDMFRENGIFRDVLLYELPESYIDDHYLKTVKSDSGWKIDATVSVESNVKGCTVKAEIFDGEKLVASAACPAAKNCNFTLDCKDIKEWNAEEPSLYETYITLIAPDGGELMTIREFTGFKKVEIKKDIFTFNGKKIKFKGVNHHDTHYKNGFVLSFDDLEKDIKLMKSLNVNAVRTSHYPPDHQFLVLCDIYGLYVVDEADIETHGCGCDPHNNINLISHDPKWEPRYVDRVSRMYFRDRNRVSVTMWSLGNEAGGYANQDACCDFLHRMCPDIPVHYEGVCNTARRAYDVYSEMYTNHENLEKTGKHRRSPAHTPKPFFLCEYAHAMGVGPGALEDYWKILYKYDNLMGGCIWEWADHAVYHSRGKLKFTYGGDHGEWRHDGNFCVDGLMYPDRRLHNGAREMQAVYRPVRASLEDGKLIFTNTNRFRNSDYLVADWQIVKNADEVIDSGSFRLDIEPNAQTSINFPVKQSKDNCDLFLNIEYKNGDNFVAREQIIINEAVRAAASLGTAKVKATEDENEITVSFKGGKAVFSKRCGFLTSLTKGTKEFINQNPANSFGFRPNIYRALLDNDAKQRDKWREIGYDNYKAIPCNVSLSSNNGAAVVICSHVLEGRKGKIGETCTVYTITNAGKIRVSTSFKPLKHKLAAKHMPRFGLSAELAPEFNNVYYYGLGEYENLCDFNAHCIIGKYYTTVEEMQEPYIKPQDSGNRTQVREFSLTDSTGCGLMFTAVDNTLSFNARRYSQTLLAGAKHFEDLKDQNTVAVNIDGFLRGTGTASCGPDTLPQYDIDGSKGLNFTFDISFIG